MVEIKTTLKERNPSKMWKLNKSIKIDFDLAGILEFICIKDNRGEDYFFCEEADYSYHRRLFNKTMSVAFEETIYNPEEILDKVSNRLINLETKKQKILSELSDVLTINKSEAIINMEGAESLRFALNVKEKSA